MNCTTHQETPAAAYCRTCGKPLCESCKREVQGLIYCEDCIAARVHASPAATSVTNPHAPNPAVAAVLGFIPGVGAMYCGEFLRAIIHVGVFAVLMAIANEVHALEILPFFWYCYMIFDSYQIAKAKREGRPIPEIPGFKSASGAGFGASGAVPPSTPPPAVTAVPSPSLVDVNRSQNMPIGPIILIGLGVLFLLHTMGFSPFHEIWKLWPLLVVGVGGWMIWQRTQRVVCHCVACTAVSMTGPALVVTVGIMGLLHEFSRFGFGETWPLLLIVFGVLKFLQITGSREGHIGPGSPPVGTPPGDSSSSAPSQQNEVSHG
jgi:hypothetical protein